MTERLIAYSRILLGLVCLINGANWFVKIITPYPSMSDFVHFLPPPDIVGAMIEYGPMFHLAKGIEVAVGLALLSNRLVPLALVIAMTVSVPVFIVDVFKPVWKLRAFMMGSGTLLLNVTLLVAYFAHYRGMLGWKAAPAGASADPPLAASLGKLLTPLLGPLCLAAAAVGTVQVGWLAVLIAQHAANPQAISDVRPMTPRPAPHG